MGNDAIGKVSLWLRNLGLGLLLPTVLLSAEPLQAEARLIFPQFANGEFKGVSNRGRFFLVNRASEAVRGRLVFRVRGGQGEAAKVPIAGTPVTEWPFEIPARGSRLVETDGTGPLVVGAVEVVTDGSAASPLEAALTFELLGSFVSVQPAAPRMRGRVFVGVSEEEDTGVAVFNPGQATARLRIELLDEAGQTLAEKDLSLEAGAHLARFVTEPDLFKEEIPLENGAFRGSLAWEVSPGGPAVSLVGLVQRASGALLALPAGEGFFQARDADIWDFRGQAALLRGLNLGGWLVPEGYILKIPGYGSPSSIRGLIVDLVGEEEAARFYDAYYANYVREVDIEAIRAWGFNSVRVPFHYNQLYDPQADQFIEEGFRRLDRVIRWCRERGLGVILDLHCAPGGQNPNNISDSDGVARLWEDETYRDQTVRVWREIARRYAWEKWVIGYDLLNEPVLPEGSNGMLQSLYQRLAEAIRQVDPNHLLFVEGNWYATDFSRLEPPVDDQLVYSFHKYWNGTARDTIQEFLNLRSRTGKPLWVGEFGENSNPWAYRVIDLFEAYGIGWCWWNHKKVDTITSPLSAPLPESYRRVVAYWEGKASRPEAAEALAGLLDLADALRLENCRVLPDVVAALTDRRRGRNPRPYAVHRIPGLLAAVDYDLGDEGYAYHDRDSLRETYENWIPWNQGWQYRNDGVDIETSADPEGVGWNIGWISDGEWLRYTVVVAASGRYDLRLRVAGYGGRLRLWWDGERLGEELAVPRTGGWQEWITMKVRDLELAAGTHVLRLDVVQGGFNLSFLEFVPAE